MYSIKNDDLTIKINPKGAELVSIWDNQTKYEYLWEANPEFWKRHSPILFPIVGGLWNDEYRHKGKIYAMSQHGFARDSEFSVVKESSNELWFELVSNDHTKKNYPFDFKLEVGYKLIGKTIQVSWLVKNSGIDYLYFQIGAHPAFNYPPLADSQSNIKGYLGFEPKGNLYYKLIEKKGCVDNKNTHNLHLIKNLLPLDHHTFDKDALIFENRQIEKVTLFDSSQKPYISLEFDAPVVGLWEPPMKNSPFICIEPWYGRCDQINYDGDFENKDWINKLTPEEYFNASYKIVIE